MGTEIQTDEQLNASIDNIFNTGDTLDQPEQPVEQTQELPTEDKTIDGAVQDNAFDWTKDTRYSEMWGQEPNNLYKSYKELETAYQTSNEEKTAFEKQISELNEKYQPHNELVDYLKEMSNNPKWGPELKNVFENYDLETRRNRFGEQIPDHVYEKLENGEKAIKKVEEFEYNTKVSENVKVVESQIDQIKQLSETHGLLFDAETEKQFLQHCYDNKIYGPNMYNAFLAAALPSIQKSIESKAQAGVTKNLNGNRSNALPVGGTHNATSLNRSNTNSNIDSMSRLESSIDSIFGI